MSRKNFWCAVLCFSLAALPAWATEVKEVVSPKGIRAWLVEEHSLPLVAVKVVFSGAGHAYDPAGKEGRAGMVAALLNEGAGDMDWRAFSEALENNAIQMDFAVDEDYLRASMETLGEHKDKAFSYLGKALASPRFDESAIERVRSQTLTLQTQQEQQPNYILQRGWQKIAYEGHAYGKPVLGTKQSVAALAKNDFSEMRRRYLTRENMVIAVVGDITGTELAGLLDEHFAALPESYEPEEKLPYLHLPAQAKQEVIEHDIPQTMVSFGMEGMKRSDPDYYAAYVMNEILGGGSLSAKLSTEIREKRGLAYSVYSQLDPMEHAASWRGGFATRNDQAGTALQTLRDTLRRFTDEGPTEAELADAKQYVTGSFMLNLDSNSDIANYLVTMQLHQLGRDYLDKRNGYMSAVTRDQVKKVARRLADPDHMLVVLVGKPNLTTK